MRYNTAGRDLKRNQTLLNAGAIAPRDLETTQQMYTNAQASLESAKAQLANAQKNLDNTQYHSSVQRDREPTQCERWRRGSTRHALFTVVDPSSMELDASVPSDQLSDVRRRYGGQLHCDWLSQTAIFAARLFV